MLADKDRIFTNLYGFQDWGLKAAQKRGDWDDTKALIARGQDSIIDAEAPLASLFGFAGELRGLSQGRAGCSMEPAAYGPAPDEVLKAFV